MKSRVTQKTTLLIFVVVILIFGTHGISYAQLPSFSSSTATRSIAENTVAGTAIGDPVTADNFNSSTDRHRLSTDTTDSPDTDSFDIDSATGQLKTKAALDYETKTSYTVVIIVERNQGGTWTEATSGSRITVTINVTDIPMKFINDEGQIITTAYRSVPENVPLNTKIGTPLVVQDPDGVTFIITDPFTNTHHTSFNIDNDGQLTTNIPLNYETKSEYKFKIRALGTGQSDLLDFIIVNVLDVNEGPPAFTEGESTTRSVIEGTPAGENIGEPLEAEDIDTDATVTYSLSGIDANAFRIDPMTGQLLTFASLDYETEKRYQVTVTASDGELESEIEVTINVEDLVPTFIEGDPATRTIVENTARGINIGDPVTATGPDIGYTLIYSLSGTDVASFDINSMNGQLITKAALNYEAKSAYTVTVSVSDGNHPADTITVNISVQNQTEGNPTFPTGTPITYTVPENTPAGVDIGFPVAAINLPANFQYSLTGTDRTAFTLNSHTGQLRTSASLNYEAQNSYSVTVNLGYTPVDQQLFVTHNITIQVENVNERPMFPGESVPRSIPENTVAGTNIGAPVAAMDPDIAGSYTDANPEDNAVDSLRYRLAGTDAAAFTLDPNTGQLKTKVGAVYDHETKPTYTVIVVVTDGEFTDETEVIISVTDTPDTVPTVVIDAPTTTQRGAFDVMVTFSEAVNGFDDPATDITLTTTLTEGTGNATASIESGSDGDSEYRVKITPPSEAEGNVTISVPAGAATNTGNTGNAASIASHVSVDTKRPTVTISAFSGTATGRFSLSITFSEDIDPDTFTASDISLSGPAATVTSLKESDSEYEYIATITPTASGNLFVTIQADKVKDTAGNGNKVGPISGAQVALGAPNVTINAPTTTQTGPFDITITFSEEIDVFRPDDISLTGTASAAVTGLTGSRRTYTATITPMSSGAVIIQVPANAVVDDDNNGNNASQTHTVTVSLTGPTVTINVPTTPQNGNFNVTITFSETVTDFDDKETDILLGSDVSATVTSLTGTGTTYTASIRPAPGVEETLRIYVPENVATNSANQGNIASNLETVRVDTVHPTVTMVDAPEIANGQFTVTFTFREDVTLADATKISISGVTYTHQVSATDNSLTVTITPTTDGTLRVKANAGVVKDGAGNLNLASQQYTVQVDRTAPTVTIRDAPTTLQSRAFDVKVKFSEPVSGFAADDITLTTTLTEGTGNATASIESGSDGDSEYTVKITPPADVVGEIAVSVPASVAKDAAENDNTASSESTVSVDTIRPTATITIPTGVQKGAFQVGIEFSEPVSGFTRTGTPLDITLTGVPATVTSLTADPDAMVSGTKYIATINPTETVNLNWVGVQVRANAAQDAAGNGNTASSTRTVPVKTKRPEVEEIELPEGEQNGEFNVRIRFDSAVSKFESTDITLGGTVSATVTVFSGVRTTYTATITPEAGEVDGTVTVRVGANVAEDVAGNGNIASSVYTVQVDTKRPTLRVQAPSTVTGAFNATIIFNEPVTGFDDPATDITLGGTAAATVTSLTPAMGSSTTYIAAITPTSNGTVEITVPADAALDAAGNGNTALTTKTTVTVTLTGPSVAITDVPTTPQNMAFDITITFSESVTGFAATDISLGTNVSATKTLTGMGASYTATITPAANVEEEITISVPANAATDTSNMGNTASSTYTVQLDTISPTLTITAPSTAHRAFDATITFSESVTGFEASDISLGGTAAATADSLTGSGKDYTATITPTSDGDLEISVPANAALDAAGNGNTASQTQTVTISLTNLAFDEGTSTDRSIVENTRTGVNIGDPVTATDVDNLTLTYSLSGTTDAASDYQLFDINASNGQLRTDAALDYETKNSYEVTVEVTNGTDIASIIVTVNVTNENEAPMFPATTDTTLKIIENRVAGTNIGVVAAADPDIAGSYTDANPDDDSVDALTYSLGGTNAAAFDIDSETGQLKTKAALNYETKNSYTVRVSVSDGSTDTDSITVTINVEDDNEAPMFSSETTTRTVSENTGAGENIGAPVTATDPDTADGDTDINPETTTVDSLVYSLLNANDPNSPDAAFDIDSGTGQLKTKAALDYEDRSQYMVTVKASDGELDDTITVTIDIDDVDDAQPTVTDIELPTGVQNAAFSVKIIFDEPVTLTGSGNITTTDSVSRQYDLSGSGNTYTATFPRVNGKVGDVILKVPAGFAKDSLNNLNIESDTYTVPVDWKDPTVTIDKPSDIQVGAFDVTITFSEAVTGFTPSDDILLSGTVPATAALKSGSDGDSIYTVTITPTGDGSVIIRVRANAVEDNAGNGNTASQPPHPSVTVDLTAPTVTITGVPATPTSSAFTVIITFNEAVTGFEANDISLGAGVSATVTNFTTVNSTRYTATINPADNVEEEVVISVPEGAAKNNANIDNTASADHRVRLDRRVPSVTITGPTTDQSNAFNITITFSEDVTGFAQGDITLSGTAAVTVTSFTGSGTTYTATITPTSNGNVVLQVSSDAAVDAVGNGNPTSDPYTVTVVGLSTEPPSIVDALGRPEALMYVKQDGVVQHGQIVAIKPFELIISFGQPVIGFEQSDLRLSNPGVTITGWVKSDKNKKYTVTATPSAEGSVTFTVPENVTHAADDGQGNVETKLYVKIDVGHDPTAAVEEDETAPRVLSIQTPSGIQSGAFDVTITFSESVTGFTASDITLSGTANARVTALTGSGSVYTATITPEANADGNVTIQVPAGAVKDEAENENTGSSTSSVRVNLARPTVEITNVPTSTQNSAFSVTIIFSDSMTGFEASDIRLGGTANATVTDLTGSRSVYTAIITPTSSGTVTIQVRADAAQGSFNRRNTASETHSVTVDLPSTTVTISVPSGAQSGAFDVTITFSDSVTGFTMGDITLGGTANATVTALTGGDRVYTATITPTSSGTVTIQVPANAARDSADHGNIASSTRTVSVNLPASGNVEIDNRLDPVMFVRQNGIDNNEQTVAPGTFQLMMDFGQPVTGFERSELGILAFGITVTITGWQRSSDGETYTATVRVGSPGGITFTVPENAVQAVDDGKGNPERKFLVLVRESEHSGAPMVSKGPPLPDETLSLPNYPNPFNPETWIPYQLAQDADVQILIYDVHGTVVRWLALGHQSAGFYTNRTRAAHWDGRNSFGEDVVSGVYFYQLHAGDISPLRKMLILK